MRRTLNIETSSGVLLQIPEALLEQPGFIFSLEARFLILLALPFEAKLDRLNWLLAGEPDTLDEDRDKTARALVMAMMVDLSEEQSALRRGGATLSARVLEEKLSNLGRLLAEPLHTQIEVGSNKWDHLIELCAGLRALAMAHKKWWKFWGRDRRLSNHLLELLERLESRFFDAYAVDPGNEVAIDSRTAGQRIGARAQELLKHFDAQGVGRGGAARLHFEQPPSLQHKLQRDIDHMRDLDARVWDAQELERAQRDEAAREAKQEELRRLNAEVRARMLAEVEEGRHTLPEATPEEVPAEVLAAALAR